MPLPTPVPLAHQDAALLDAIRRYADEHGWDYSGDCPSIIAAGESRIGTYCSVVRPTDTGDMDVLIGLVQSGISIIVTFRQVDGAWIVVGERRPSV